MISIWFTAFSFVAVLLHLYNLRDVELDRRAVAEARISGVIALIAYALVRVEVSRLIINLLLLVAGLGVLTGHGYLAYTIAGIPVVSVIASILDIRSRRRQFKILQS